MFKIIHWPIKTNINTPINDESNHYLKPYSRVLGTVRWLKAQAVKSAESTHSCTCPAFTDAAWSQHLFLSVMTLHCRSDKHKHKIMYLQSDHLSLSAASLQPSSWYDGGHNTNQLLLLLLWFGKLSALNDLKALRRQSVILSLTLPYLLSFTVWFFVMTQTWLLIQNDGRRLYYDITECRFNTLVWSVIVCFTM